MLMSGCLTASPFQPEVVDTPEFQPEMFFAGKTTGDGTLVQHWKQPREFRVDGRGMKDASDGSFVLEQNVTYDDGATEHRVWHLRQTGAHTYAATLSDASGAVTAETKGNTLHLHYLIRQPAVYMDQWLYLQPDGTTVLNVATVSVLCVPWARVSERITRAGTGEESGKRLDL